MTSIHTESYRDMIALLKEGRLRAGLFQREVGELLNGSTQSYMSKVEACELRLDIVDYYRIAKIVGITNDEILERLNKHL